MPQFEPARKQDEGEDRLFRLAELLGLDIPADDLATLAQQLSLLGSLEIDELQDYPPILKMDADWHD